MTEIGWDAPAQVQERDDCGSDLNYHFNVLHKGTLAQMVAHVMALPLAERARLVVDAGRAGTFSVTEVAALASRPDFPSAPGGATP